MDPEQTIILYDIPSQHRGGAWSPNTWKTRYCLNYKRLNYRTEWVEYPDIEDLYKRLGIVTKSKRADGTPYAGLPVIHDPSTGQTVSESFDIAKYLDATYPSTPPLFPEGSTMLISAFARFYIIIAGSTLASLVASEVKLNEASRELYEQGKTKTFKKERFEDTRLLGEDRKKRMSELQVALGQLADLYKLNKNGDCVMGQTLSYADIWIASSVKYIQVCLPEWEEVKEWHGRRWARCLELLDSDYGQIC